MSVTVKLPIHWSGEYKTKEQKDSYGCDDYRVSNAYADEIPTEEEILYLDQAKESPGFVLIPGFNT